MLVDANLLLYAVDEESPFHLRAAKWLTRLLNGTHRVGLPWISLLAFVRISTNPRISATPLKPDEAIGFVDEWLASDLVWIPQPGTRNWVILSELVDRYQLRGNLVTDAHLAALALEHGLTVCSADTDFARFTDISWVNPVQ